MPAGPAAVLWDMDGTLVDPEPYWIATEYELADRFGGTWSHEHAMNLVGNDLLVSGRYIREHMGIDVAPEAIVELLLDGVVARVEQEVPWRPGALDLLAGLRAAGVPAHRRGPGRPSPLPRRCRGRAHARRTGGGLMREAAHRAPTRVMGRPALERRLRGVRS